MAILVTGGSGFVGQSVVAALAELGEELVLLTRDGSFPGESPRGARVVRGDVTSLDDVASAMVGCEYVVHMAAMVSMWHRRRERFREVNLTGLRNVIQAASFRAIEKIVYTSTVLALGYTDGCIADERAEPATPIPRNLYMATKAEALTLARDWASQGVPLVILYPGIVYGPGPRREAGIMNQLLTDLLRGRLPATVGPGDRRWCHAFSRDVALGHRLAIEKGVAGSGYVLGGVNATLRDWLGAAARLAGVKPPRFELPYGVARLLGQVELLRARAGLGAPLLTPDVVEVFRHEWAFDSTRAVRELGYTITDLETGLEQTIRSLRERAA